MEADAPGVRHKVLADPVEAASKTDWRQRYARAMSEVLHEVEKRRSEPTGPRRYVKAVLGFLADWAPPVAFMAGLVFFLLKAFKAWGQGDAAARPMGDFFLPFRCCWRCWCSCTC